MKDWILFSLKLETRQGCPFLPFLFNIIPEVLASTIRQEKEIKTSLWERKKKKLPLFPDDKTLYVENSKKFTKNSTGTNKGDQRGSSILAQNRKPIVSVYLPWTHEK